MAQVGAAGTGEGCVTGAAQLLNGVHRRVHAVEGEAGAGEAEREEYGVDLAEGAGEERVVDTGRGVNMTATRGTGRRCPGRTTPGTDPARREGRR
jgi:hypothetical protein